MVLQNMFPFENLDGVDTFVTVKEMDDMLNDAFKE